MEEVGLENTPQYEPYEDETEQTDFSSASRRARSHTPKVGEHYIRAEILLPRGDQMARGHVAATSLEANGNVMDRYRTILILDTRMYQVEFAGGKITELTANIIA